MSEQSIQDIFRPVVDLFSQQQLQVMLLALLPTMLGDYITTKVYMVDVFLMSVLSTAVVAFLATGSLYGNRLFQWLRSDMASGSIGVQINYYRAGYWGEDMVNTYYTALAWMISRAAQGLESGEFILMPSPDYEDSNKALEFSLLPQYTSSCFVEYEGSQYHISYNQNNQNSDGGNGGNNSDSGKKGIPPAIIIRTSAEDKRNVDWATDFLRSVYESHQAHEKDKKERGRWEIKEHGNWFYVLKQHSNRGLESVALGRSEEKELNHDLKTFMADRDFYARVGLPYRRGYLFHGKPGTGKTSLINAISAELNRDVYYMNLRNIKSDTMLQSALSSVPENQVVVFEDIDAMSRVCHRRDRDPFKALSLGAEQSAADKKASSSDETKTASKTTSEDEDIARLLSGPLLPGASSLSGPFTLSCLLNCLDGHILNEGVIIIMTSNHPEKLDPALIRAGRVDLKLELNYTSRYQVQRMYDLVVKGDDEKRPSLDPTWLESFAEMVVPPCECMRVMVLYRREPLRIPLELDLLVQKYSEGHIDPELLAKDLEVCEMPDSGVESDTSADASTTSTSNNEEGASDTSSVNKETTKESACDSPAASSATAANSADNEVSAASTKSDPDNAAASSAATANSADNEVSAASTKSDPDSAAASSDLPSSTVDTDKAVSPIATAT